MINYERIQLVILSYNRLDCLPKLFDELLLPAARLNVLVTFVDNNSDLELQRFLEMYKNIPNIEVIINYHNYGVSKGRNIGFKKVEREFVINLDDDSLIEIEQLNQIPDIFDELPDVGILAFRVVHGLTEFPQNDHGDKLIQVANFHGAGHAIRNDLFNTVGYLDENCFFGAEEIEFSMRALKAGFKTVYTPSIRVCHFSFPRSGNVNYIRRFYWARNYSMVLFRYLPLSKAILFTFRLLISYSINEFMLLFIFPFAIIIGCVKGLMTRDMLDVESVAFYSNPNTRPEIGNVSILKKMKLKRTILSY